VKSAADKEEDKFVPSTLFQKIIFALFIIGHITMLRP